jgi:glycosyltransferase involved in cell wall biosynthesis
VLFLYHPDPRKGATDGIEALRRLPADTAVRIVGTVRPAAPLPWSDFEFHPDDRTLRKRYSEATVLLYPSRYEGFGLPPLEAMACGCPSVTTSVGAVPEFATDGVNATVVAPGDVAAMATGLRRLLTDREYRDCLSRHGVTTAQAYALTRVAPLFEQALTRALTASCSDST